jgi:hypothetical protein
MGNFKYKQGHIWTQAEKVEKFGGQLGCQKWGFRVFHQYGFDFVK